MEEIPPDPRDEEIKALKARIKTLEMVVLGYEDKAVNHGHFHRISMLRSALETLASGQCLDTAKQHAQAALNADYNISLRELADLPETMIVNVSREEFVANPKRYFDFVKKPGHQVCIESFGTLGIPAVPAEVSEKYKRMLDELLNGEGNDPDNKTPPA